MTEKLFKQELLERLYTPYRGKKGSDLKYNSSNSIVFGEGNPDASLIFIGEAPGEQEDQQGRPFVGRSGALLNRSLDALGIDRSDVFITNIVKCRPPNNRKPTPAEIKAHKKLLLDQIKIVRPKIICTLGASALEGLLDQPTKITQVRGKLISWDGIPVIPTYHPAYILRNPKELKTFIADLEKVIQFTQSE